MISGVFSSGDEYISRGGPNKARIYFIDPAGDNATGDGSQALPWKTLQFACTQVTTPGDVIYVNPGTYNETAASLLNVGVNIRGAGNTSIINSNYAASYTIRLESLTEGTKGSQSISHIKMTGGLVAFSPIGITARSNVKIHHCTFENFLNRGVCFDGAVGFGNCLPGTNRATGNKFYNNTLTNCGLTFNQGNVNIGGQKGMQIYDNVIIQPDRGTGNVAMGIKTLYNGYCEGLDIHNNYIEIAPWDGVAGHWDFGIELVHNLGGINVYENEIYGRFDISSLIGGVDACNDSMGYGYAVKFHHNLIGQLALRNKNEVAVDFEHDCNGGCYVYNNHIKNVFAGVYLSLSGNQDDFYCYYNLIENIGTLGVPHIGYGVRFSGTGICNNLNFDNNVILGAMAESLLSGFYNISASNITDMSIRNNIVRYFDDACIDFENGTYTNLRVENNIFFNNGSGNNPVYTGSVIVNKVEQNNIIADPLFVGGGDYHLTVGSPAIASGVMVGLEFDYSDNPVNDPPERGIYSYP